MVIKEPVILSGGSDHQFEKIKFCRVDREGIDEKGNIWERK